MYQRVCMLSVRRVCLKELYAIRYWRVCIDGFGDFVYGWFPAKASALSDCTCCQVYATDCASWPVSFWPFHTVIWRTCFTEQDCTVLGLCSCTTALVQRRASNTEVRCLCCWHLIPYSIFAGAACLSRHRCAIDDLFLWNQPHIIVSIPWH